jgi:hypothetical protein
MSGKLKTRYSNASEHSTVIGVATEAHTQVVRSSSSYMATFGFTGLHVKIRGWVND